MKVILIISAMCVVLSVACSKEPKDEKIPECVLQKINTFEKTIACENTATVSEYLFQGKTVYVFDPGTCGYDLASDVIDKNCTYLGFLNGFAGNRIINGEDFAHATFVETIWSN